ncbi:replication initiation and membrane attachment family protein [Paenibacillus cymbidii]|uniref:helicase DnaB n=1 Tax=Paenibacillus cymbidii TaxID=1639034 RepID=UPI001081EA1D|nr:helicase DnaB [Paenibacillus cymbidii]
MRISNMLHFTEQHRYCVNRHFSLGSLDYKMLSSIYQPMLGGAAIALYQTLYQQLAGDRVGYSALEQQRRLFLLLELEQGERGRRALAEQASRLEAVGLLQTSRWYLEASEETVFEYKLFQPLSPYEFFSNHHLTLLLRDKVGKYTLLFLREDLLAAAPPELAGGQAENISTPFYDLFKLGSNVVDHELEQVFAEAASAGKPAAVPDVTSHAFQYADIIARFPRGSRNRAFVEQLRYQPEQMAAINMIAKKYGLSQQELCRLLDEDAVFDEAGKLLADVMQYRANLVYRQGRRREESFERAAVKAETAGGEAGTTPPPEEKTVEMSYLLAIPDKFTGQCDKTQYNTMLRNEPYTLVLKKFFAPGTVPRSVLDVFEKIDLNYKLNEEVINVLIHFIQAEKRSWAEIAVDKLAADLLGRGVATYEQAVDFFRVKSRFREQAAAKALEPAVATSPRRQSRQPAKPKIPMVADSAGQDPISAEEREEMWRLAKKLDEGRK